MFRGSYVALVTPFKEDGSIDWEGWEALVGFHLENKTDGLVPCGTTGETPTLSLDERKELITRTIKQVEGKVPVIAGTGSNGTQGSIEFTKWAEDAGATAALVVVPYYNKPTPEGQYRHFEAIAKASKIPLVLYNVPGRTACNMPPHVVKRLAELDTVKAIKEASGNVAQAMEISRHTDLDILSGEDALIVPLLSIGGKGVISVCANIIPRDTHDMIDKYLNGQVEEAKEMALKMYDLVQALFIETNPIPVKTALKLMGKIGGTFRLPLCEMKPENEAHLKKAMEEYGGLL